MHRGKSKVIASDIAGSPRQIPEIVEQLNDLLKMKESAQSNAAGDFADSLMFNTILRQERSLYSELRTALSAALKRTPQKKVS